MDASGKSRCFLAAQKSSFLFLFRLLRSTQQQPCSVGCLRYDSPLSLLLLPLPLPFLASEEEEERGDEYAGGASSSSSSSRVPYRKWAKIILHSCTPRVPKLVFLHSILILSLGDAFFLASSTQQLSPNRNVQTCCFSPLSLFCPGWFLLLLSSYAGKGRMMYAMAINAPFVFRGGRRPPNREALFHTTHTARTTLTTSRIQAMCAIWRIFK